MRTLTWLLLLLSPIAVIAQDTPKFDAIVVRRHDPSDTRVGGIHWGGLVFEANNVPLTFLITQAYGVKEWLIQGLPPWANKTTWDMSAKVTAGDLKTMQSLSRETRSRMLQNVLSDQFGLTYHMTSMEQPVYELTVLPGGPKFHAASTAEGTSWTFATGNVACNSISMAQFANGLSPLVERSVVDHTGLSEHYTLRLHWTPEDKPSGDADTTPGIFTAVREQLGLKLTAAKAPVPALAVESIHPPEDN